MKACSRSLILDGIEIEMLRKGVKHLRLVVSPPDGRVRMSVPWHISDHIARAFLDSRLEWVKTMRARYAAYLPPVQHRMQNGETHAYLGRPLCLEINETAGKQCLVKAADKLVMRVRPGTKEAARRRLLYEWYRAELKSLVPDLLEKWQPRVGREAVEWRVRRMKTRWGSCNIDKRRIWLNLELVKKPPSCIEYVLVHELVHLLEKHHNRRFKAHMERLMPDWRVHERELERPPIYDVPGL